MFSEETGIVKKMLYSLYYSILMLGLNEIGPVNNIELLYVTFGLILTSLVNAQIFGEMAVLISTISKKKTNYQAKLDQANASMQKVQLPIELQDDIREYIAKTMNTRD
jgi:hypothetical protein